MIMRPHLTGAFVVLLLGAPACTNGEGNEANVLPDPSGGTTSVGMSESSSSSGGMINQLPICDEYLQCLAEVAPTEFPPALDAYGPSGSCWESADAAQACGTACESGLVDLEDALGEDACEEVGPLDPTPLTYRFDCVDIQGVGDADGSAIQAQILENTWRSDIDDFKLNIMLEVSSRDSDTGEASLGIRSGVGPDSPDLCAQPDTISDEIPVSFVAGESRWEASGEVGECSRPAEGSEGITYEMSLPPDRVVYIYAEDDDTTTFNCTADAAIPDAVPIRAVQAEVSTNAAEDVIWGTLQGCLVQSDAQALCSCLGSCAGEGPDDLQTEGECAGCPVGSTPLETLLGGVNPSANCTEVMGAPSFDLTIGFSGVVLPHVPTACG